MKSASNVGILNSSLQMLHVHVLLVALLGANYTGAAASFPVQPFNHFIGANTVQKIAIGQRFPNAILHLLNSLFPLHREQLFHHGFSFLFLTVFLFSCA